MFTIDLVCEDELHKACEIMQEAAKWLESKGSPLWNLAGLTPENMMVHVRAKELFMAKVNGEHAGTILLQEDQMFWPELTDRSSLFFHKLAVKRKFAGMGVSSALMAYAYETAKSRGKTHLRMDCSARHPQLRAIYEKNGFQFLDQKQSGPWLVNRLYRVII